MTWTPGEAAALHALDLLPASALPELAVAWMMEGRDSGSMRILAGERDPIMSEVDPHFTATLRELSVSVPGREEAALTLLKVYVQRIASGAMDPFEGMARLDRDVCRCDIFSDASYVGDALGLERMYTWYRELQDLYDGSALNYHADLPREEAEKRFRENLIEAAQGRLEAFQS